MPRQLMMVSIIHGAYWMELNFEHVGVLMQQTRRPAPARHVIIDEHIG
jgi:hypothetical protein